MFLVKILSKEKTPFLTASNISGSEFPKNGGTPDKRMYKITPPLHTSQLWSYVPERTSGDI